MAEVGTYDFMWVRGTTAPFVVQMVINSVPIALDDIRLTVFKSGGKTLAFRISLAANNVAGPGGVQETAPGIFTFTPTAAQTRSLTETARGAPGKNTYEVEVRNGTSENVYLLGVISAVGGINDDEGIV
jgi:hypothetical protein